MRVTLPISKFSPAHLVSRVTVRTRIVIIAMIPVIGFLANGAAFMTAHSEIEAAFRSAHESAEVAEASREFKMALTAMRMRAREFAAHPSYDDVTAFAVAHDNAARFLDTMAATSVVAQKGEIAEMQIKVAALKESFSGLIRTQELVGFSENEGLRQKLVAAGRAAELMIVENLAALSETDFQQLLISLATMRLNEAQFRNTRDENFRQRFADEFLEFNNAFDATEGLADAKQQLSQQVQTYVSTFSDWALAASSVRPWVVSIDSSSEQMLPDADRIIASARTRADEAATMLAASQA